MNQNPIQKPELLLPSGSVETFYAAAEGGADAVYLGMKQFNARGRANNFSFSQLAALRKETRSRGMKMYITLNTVVKNKELSDLFYSLSMLQRIKPDAVIIQDWGVFHIIQKHFPGLSVHASTQMGNHNSLGLQYADKRSFDRVILARELTADELESMLKKSDIEAEVFVHGALCYSFSGMCLFSSYVGGAGANRGWCKQPCRRTYQKANGAHFIFSLKDHELIDYVPQMTKMGVTSLKIEGRLKSAEYVHRVAQAYRMVIDDPTHLAEAKELLTYDFGREKTSYFYGKKVAGSITSAPNTGIYLGKISAVKENGLRFDLTTQEPLDEGYLLRIRNNSDESQNNVKIRSLSKEGSVYHLEVSKEGAAKNDQVFLAGMRSKKFPSRFPDLPQLKAAPNINQKFIRIRKAFQTKHPAKAQEFYVRIDSANWLRKIRVPDYSGIFLKLLKDDWEQLPVQSPFFQKNLQRFYIELPKFIPEKDIPFYGDLCKKMFNHGVKKFMLSHISQKELLPKGSLVYTNENVYVFNDAAASYLLSDQVKNFVYPLENEWDNLYSGKERGGILPVYFYPELFYSRMPVDIPHTAPQIRDNDGTDYEEHIRNGIRTVIPKQPVSFSLYANKILAAGFRSFLFDLSYINPSSNIPSTLLKRWKNSEQIQPSVTFNFKKGMK